MKTKGNFPYEIYFGNFVYQFGTELVLSGNFVLMILAMYYPLKLLAYPVFCSATCIPPCVGFMFPVLPFKSLTMQKLALVMCPFALLFALNMEDI